MWKSGDDGAPGVKTEKRWPTTERLQRYSGLQQRFWITRCCSDDDDDDDDFLIPQYFLSRVFLLESFYLDSSFA